MSPRDAVHADWSRCGIAVVGAGVMGVGIASLAVGHGLPVVLVDAAEDVLGRAPEVVNDHVRLGRLLGTLPAEAALGRLTMSMSIEAVSTAGAVVETVTELPEVKAMVLTEVSAAVPPGTLLTSNTSAIPVAELAAATVRPEDLVGTHFMNPAHLIEAVEVVRGADTGDAAMASLESLFSVLGRRMIVVGDGPGFVSNRILMRVINDAARMVEEGRAAAKDVDDIFVSCFGHRTGPLATADLIGLDNVVDTLHVLFARTGDDTYSACPELVARVQAGCFGRKTGQGFFEYGESLS
jgi:methoxymalonate biosynthesis protein